MLDESLWSTAALSGATMLDESLWVIVALSGSTSLLFCNVESEVEGVLLNKSVESEDNESTTEVSLLGENVCKLVLFNNFLLSRNCLLNLKRSFKSKTPAKELAETLPYSS